MLLLLEDLPPSCCESTASKPPYVFLLLDNVKAVFLSLYMKESIQLYGLVAIKTH